MNFNPRPPRGGRPNSLYMALLETIFQSTPSARRATLCTVPCPVQALDFNPRPPRGGRPGNFRGKRPGGRISIHALREEGDPSLPDAAHYRNAFQSTPSARRATPFPPGLPRPDFYFNPRPPRGGRLIPFRCAATRPRFQSTPSARRATVDVIHGLLPVIISIHALREEGDPLFIKVCDKIN